MQMGFVGTSGTILSRVPPTFHEARSAERMVDELCYKLLVSLSIPAGFALSIGQKPGLRR